MSKEVAFFKKLHKLHSVRLAAVRAVHRPHTIYLSLFLVIMLVLSYTSSKINVFFVLAPFEADFSTFTGTLLAKNWEKLTFSVNASKLILICPI